MSKNKQLLKGIIREAMEEIEEGYSEEHEIDLIQQIFDTAKNSIREQNVSKLTLAISTIKSLSGQLLGIHQQQQVSEEAPAGWEGTVKAMKKHKDIDNPWALSHWMKNKGMKSHKEGKINEILSTYDDLAEFVKSLPSEEIKKITDISKTKNISAYDAIVEYLRQLAAQKHDISK